MNENFAKFKKKVWIEILIKCCITALLAAFLAIDAVLLPCKLYGVHILWVFYVLIGIGGFAIGGGIAFLFLRTNDKEIAKRMDAELNLAERVQTAYIFGNQKSEILDLQLEDTVNTLKPIPARALPFKALLATILCGVVAVAAVAALPVLAVTVPPVFAKTDVEGPGKEPPRDISDWEWAALDDLIKYVQDSKKADAESKNAMVTDLYSLKNLLLSGVSQSSLSAFVSNTATKISNDVKTINDVYPKDAEGNPHPQATANSEEAAYVVSRLYEIFDLLPSSSNGNNNNGGNNNGDDPDNNGDDPDTDKPITGGLNTSGAPVFDPEKGYITCGEAHSEYYKQMQAAFNDGAISKEEWEDILVSYFSNINKDD